MKYSEAQAIIISKRENEFRKNAVIFAEQIAGDDALIAALLRWYRGGDEIDADDLQIELSRIEKYYSGKNIDEEVEILLIENGGSKDELGEWL